MDRRSLFKIEHSGGQRTEIPRIQTEPLRHAWANVTGIEPRAPLDAVRMSRKKMWVRHDKAARELGYAPVPAADALGRAVAWFRENGYC